MKRTILIVVFCLCAGWAAQAQLKIAGTPPASAEPADPIAALEKKVMTKLNDIEEKLDRLERAQSANDSQLDDMARDLGEVRRDNERRR